MPSYDQLDNEEEWRDEVAAPALLVLANRLKLRFPGAGVWVRGDNAHMRGYHRSRRWIQNSIYCTDRNYSVTRTLGDRQGGDGDWACAMDIGLPQADLIPMCQRLDVACRAGRLEKVTEWFGNTGGDQRVDGWDNIGNRVASADSSHLTHLHMSFDRGRANEDHSDLYEILVGDDMPEWFRQEDWDNLRWRNYSVDVDGSNVALGGPAVGQRMWLPPFLKAMSAKIDLIASKVDIDPAELDAIMQAASEGAQQGVIQSTEELATAIAEALADDLGLTPQEAEAAAERAMRRVLGGLDEPV